MRRAAPLASLALLISTTSALAGAPSISTLPAVNVQAASARLEALVNPQGEQTTAWFRYGTAHPGTCSDAFGTRVPLSGLAAGNGMSASTAAHTVAGLTPGATYWYCAVAQNASGLVVGGLGSFTTVNTPAAITGAASVLTMSSATLNGSGNPHGLEASGWFRISTTHPGACNDTFGTRVPAAGNFELGDGTGAVAFSETVTGLTTGTFHYYCAIVQNAAGTTFGAVESFFPAQPPTVLSEGPLSVTNVAATLRGAVNANGSATTAWFRIGTSNPGLCSDTFGVRAPASGGLPVGGGTAAVGFQETVGGLLPSTEYWYCGIAENAGGRAYGPATVLKTLGPPSVDTHPAANVTWGSATLRGEALSRGVNGLGWFRLSDVEFTQCSDSVGVRVPSTGGLSIAPSALTPVPFSMNAPAPQPGRTYWYCALASNAYGTRAGTVMSFTMAPFSPYVTTLDPGPVTSVGLTLRANVSPNGLESTAYFRLGTSAAGGCSASWGQFVPLIGVTIPAGGSPVLFEQVLPAASLQPNGLYFYCAVASNQLGWKYGSVMSFRAPALPVVKITPPAQLAGTFAVLSGTVHPGNTPTTAWFRYGTSSPGETCNDTFGTRAPWSGGLQLAAGNDVVPFTQSITGLTRGTTYFVCAFAQNALGTVASEVLTVTAHALPEITSTSASDVTRHEAVLTAEANPGGAETVGWFRYAPVPPNRCDESFGIRVPAAGGIPLGAGKEPVPFSHRLEGLLTGVTYHWCAYAKNDEGQRDSGVQTFNARLEPPEVVTKEAVPVVSRSARLWGSANPNDRIAQGWFRYGRAEAESCSDTFGTRLPLSGSIALGNGELPVDFGLQATGLSPNARYHYCAVASNEGGTAFGELVSFTTAAESPSIETLEVSPPGDDGAYVLKLKANANGSAGSAWFVLSQQALTGCASGVGERVPAEGLPLAADERNVTLEWRAEALAPGTWWYCALAETETGTAQGEVKRFEVPRPPPVAGCSSASSNGSASVPFALLTALLFAVAVRRRGPSRHCS